VASTATGPLASDTASYLIRWSSAPDVPDESLRGTLASITNDLPGSWGIAVKKLDTGQTAFVGANNSFVSASLYKLGVLLTIARLHADGIISYNDKHDVDVYDNTEDYANGDPGIDPGTTLTIQRAAELMIDESNNTAASFLIRILGNGDVYKGQRLINSVLSDAGFSGTHLDFDNDNVTNPADMVRYFEKLYSSQLVSPEESRWMLDILLQQQLNYLIPANLPTSVLVAHKTGSLDGVMHDAGIMFTPAGPVAIAILAQGLNGEDVPRDVMPKIARRVYNYFVSHDTASPRYFVETKHAVGGAFLQYWYSNGALAQFGYPLTDEMQEDGLTVQYFERARFEYHTKDNAYPVQLSLLGSYLIGQQQISTAAAADAGGEQNFYFMQTKHNLSKSFLSYWRANGGLSIFGLPLTERFEQVNTVDGKKYVVQYFERARFELHDDGKGNYYVLLGMLGYEVLKQRSSQALQQDVERIFDESLRVGSF